PPRQAKLLPAVNILRRPDGVPASAPQRAERDGQELRFGPFSRGGPRSRQFAGEVLAGGDAREVEAGEVNLCVAGLAYFAAGGSGMPRIERVALRKRCAQFK